MVNVLDTPIRRLEGISYWVIEDPGAIHDFITTEIRKEWEEDAKSERRDPEEDSWLRTLSNRSWRLTVTGIDAVKLNPGIMGYVDSVTGYNFAKSLAARRQSLEREIRRFAQVIWPVIVRGEDMMLVDGYCRYAALRAMGVSRIYAYVGTVVGHQPQKPGTLRSVRSAGGCHDAFRGGWTSSRLFSLGRLRLPP